ncbi:hypothetical protein [Paenibacillus sp. GCM10027626]|uniref:hypothetical protein n=1 Tax=Paenibacillus sp. GCM10027626 TaxID=3273411 RepID=UPI003630869F
MDKEVIPKLNQVNYQLKLLKPKTAELQAVHKNVLQFSDLELDGFTLQKKSYAGGKSNRKLYNQGKTKLDKAESYFQKAIEQLQGIKTKVFSLIEEI